MRAKSVTALLLALALRAGAASPIEPGTLLIAPGSTPAYRSMVAAAERAVPRDAARQTIAESQGRPFVRALASALERRQSVVLIAPTAALTLDETTRRALLADVAPRALRSGARLHALAVGDGTDPLFVRQLSQVTGGTTASVTNANQVATAIAHAWHPPADDLARELTGDAFYVSRDSGPVTLLVRLADGQPIEIRSPLEQIVDVRTFSPLIEWYQEGNTALVTLSAPTPGRWRIEGARESIRVFHDLALELLVEGTAAANPIVTAQLTDAHGDVDEPLLWELSELRMWLSDATSVTPLDVKLSSGRLGSATTSRRPRTTLPAALADGARVLGSLDARTFRLTSRYPPDAPVAVTATLVPLDRSMVVARVKVIDTTIVEAGMRVYATLRVGTERSKVIVAAHDGDRAWTTELPPLATDLSVAFKVKGQTISGAPFDVETQPLRWSSPLREAIVREFDVNGRMLGNVVEPEIAPLDSDATDSTTVSTNAVAPTDVTATVAAAPADDSDVAQKSASLAEPSHVWTIALAAGIALVANLVLAFALIRRSRSGSDSASARLAAAVDGYRRALEARAI
jgi:hypothetical protein